MKPTLTFLLTILEHTERRLVQDVQDDISFEQFMKPLRELEGFSDSEKLGLSYCDRGIGTLLAITSEAEWKYGLDRRFTQPLKPDGSVGLIYISLIKRTAPNNDRLHGEEDWNALTASRDALQVTNAAQTVELAKLREADATQAVQMEKLLTANLAQSQALVAALGQAGAGETAESEQAEASGSRPRKSARRGA